MDNRPLVSTIVIFLNAEHFIQEAIESVLAQTYENWELLLIDDGSTDASTQIAMHFASQFPGKVSYFEHPGHQNRGMGASRNLGIRHAKGEYIAFLDADDLWLPNKLIEQIAYIEEHPEAGMLYGNTVYWFSWTGRPADLQKDLIPNLGVESNTIFDPPHLLPLYLRGKAAVPCTCSILVRREVAEEVNGFDETFYRIDNIYEDQAFYAKVCLEYPVMVINTCWDKYRQHPGGSVALAKATNRETVARTFFLNWLDDYMKQSEFDDAKVRQAIRKELWRMQIPNWLPESELVRTYIRWFKKWVLRLEEWVLPGFIQRRLRIQD